MAMIWCRFSFRACSVLVSTTAQETGLSKDQVHQQQNTSKTNVKMNCCKILCRGWKWDTNKSNMRALNYRSKAFLVESVFLIEVLSSLLILSVPQEQENDNPPSCFRRSKYGTDGQNIFFFLDVKKSCSYYAFCWGQVIRINCWSGVK